MAKKNDVRADLSGRQIDNAPAGNSEVLRVSAAKGTDGQSSREKQALLSLSSPYNISELDYADKKYLLSLLYTLSEMVPEENEFQQTYLRSVASYLGVKDVPGKADFSRIDRIDSKAAERAILQCVMEYLYLETGSHDYWERGAVVLDHFDVRHSEIRKAEASIDAFCQAVGIDGLSVKYGNPDSDGLGSEPDGDEISACLELLQNFQVCGMTEAVLCALSSHYPGNVEAKSDIACQSKAEKAIRLYYNGFSELLSASAVVQLESENIGSRLKPLLLKLQRCLSLLPDGEVPLGQLNALLTGLNEFLTCSVQSGLHGCTCSLNPFPHYVSRITIERYRYADSMFAVCDYACDCCSAAQAIFSDAMKCAFDIDERITSELRIRIAEQIPLSTV